MFDLHTIGTKGNIVSQTHVNVTLNVHLGLKLKVHSESALFLKCYQCNYPLV